MYGRPSNQINMSESIETQQHPEQKLRIQKGASEQYKPLSQMTNQKRRYTENPRRVQSSTVNKSIDMLGGGQADIEDEYDRQRNKAKSVLKAQASKLRNH